MKSQKHQERRKILIEAIKDYHKTLESERESNPNCYKDEQGIWVENVKDWTKVYVSEEEKKEDKQEVISVNLTEKESQFLINVVYPSQIDISYSDLQTGNNIKDRVQAGLISSLQKKGLIKNIMCQDSFKVTGETPYKMWAVTRKCSDIFGEPPSGWSVEN